MSKNKISGIYIIINIVNNFVYIGQSVDVKSRFRDHKSRLRNNKHNNERLQNAWNKYGEENFLFKLLEVVEIDDLDEKEIFWIKHYDSSNRDLGYNIEHGGNEKKQVPTETRIKISLNHADTSGKNNPFYGKKHSAESKEKIKNRHYAFGESHAGAILTEQDVLIIKQLINESKHTITEISKMFNVKPACISKIKHGRTWTHVKIA